MFGKIVLAVSPGTLPVIGKACSEGLVLGEESDVWVVLWTDGERAGSFEDVPKSSILESVNSKESSLFIERGVSQYGR